GVNTLRPEIIAISDTFPLYASPSSLKILNDYGFSLEAYWQLQLLRRDTLGILLKKIKEWNSSEFDKSWESVYQNFKTQMASINDSILFIKNISNTIEYSKNQIDLKLIPDNSFDTENHKTIKEM